MEHLYVFHETIVLWLMTTLHCEGLIINQMLLCSFYIWKEMGNLQVSLLCFFILWMI